MAAHAHKEKARKQLRETAQGSPGPKSDKKKSSSLYKVQRCTRSSTQAMHDTKTQHQHQASHARSSAGACAPELGFQLKWRVGLRAGVGIHNCSAKDHTRCQQGLNQLRDKVGVLCQHVWRHAGNELGRSIICRATPCQRQSNFASARSRVHSLSSLQGCSEVSVFAR